MWVNFYVGQDQGLNPTQPSSIFYIKKVGITFQYLQLYVMLNSFVGLGPGIDLQILN
jgi:hypothetical protein